MPTTYHYETVPGFFVYDTEGQGSSTDSAVPPTMELIDKSEDRWDKFRKKIAALNEELREHDAEVKVFFFARHGQSWHNLGRAKYESERWDEEMGRKDGDDEITWGPDPELTPFGINHAVEAKCIWEAELPFNIMLPDRLYSSPLTRAIQTLQITFEGIVLGNVKDKRTVTILENCRGTAGLFTCCKRRTRSYIHERFPDYEIEEAFEEEDKVWNREARETKDQVAERARQVLDYIFEKDTSSTCISVTTHGGIITQFFRVMGRCQPRLPTAGIIPVVVKCQRNSVNQPPFNNISETCENGGFKP